MLDFGSSMKSHPFLLIGYDGSPGCEWTAARIGRDFIPVMREYGNA
jgi:hypothetical protein